MLLKRKRTLIAAVIMVISLFVGCSNDVADKVYDDNSKICKEYDTFGMDNSNEKVEQGVYKANLKISGDTTIWEYKSDKDFDLKVPYNLSVKGGKGKIVLISPDDKVTTLAEKSSKADNGEKESMMLSIKKGNNRIKLVGYKKADMNVEIHLDKGNFKTNS
ncbi:50S ribosomal protein L7ae [Clostridium sp. JS66]|uniref:50S ribosomal protein L7ae n=1 Tax=Clostridium sp. JS66 TaxID=3064705 RepID=UPI00298D66B2|nr:50S ribosomal protein L7ae [Clostridium sp. JS66]WPC44357.1 50S ribosomal protein L7ae [Clostridium sp. JS66]